MNVLKTLLEKAKLDFQIDGLVHGGISSEFQKKSFEKICKENNLNVITPLWGINPREYMDSLLNSNFKFIYSTYYSSY